MSSHEINHTSNFDPKDPLRVIDHQAVSVNIRSYVDMFTTVSEAIRHEQELQMALDIDVYNQLLNVSQYLVAMDTNGEFSNDVTRKRIFVSSMVLALKTIDATCESLRIDASTFRRFWLASGVAKIINTDSNGFEEKTAAEKHKIIGEGIESSGHTFLNTIDFSYVDTIKYIADEHTNLMEPSLFKASYAYVLGSAQQALARTLQELEVQRIISECDFDTGIDYLTEEFIQTYFPSDYGTASKLHNQIFCEIESGAEAYIGQEIEKQLEVNEKVAGTLQMLALSLYPNELHNGALDETGEAFFYGAVLALRYKDELCSSMKVDVNAADRAWWKDKTHIKLYKMDCLPKGREDVIDSKVVKTLQKTELSKTTSLLVDKISRELDYNIYEVSAFKNGFQYTLETYRKAIKTTINARISARVKLAKKGLDQELETLLGHRKD